MQSPFSPILISLSNKTLSYDCPSWDSATQGIHVSALTWLGAQILQPALLSVLCKQRHKEKSRESRWILNSQNTNYPQEFPFSSYFFLSLARRPLQKGICSHQQDYQTACVPEKKKYCPHQSHLYTHT